MEYQQQLNEKYTPYHYHNNAKYYISLMCPGVISPGLMVTYTSYPAIAPTWKT